MRIKLLFLVTTFFLLSGTYNIAYSENIQKDAAASNISEVMKKLGYVNFDNINISEKDRKMQDYKRLIESDAYFKEQEIYEARQYAKRFYNNEEPVFNPYNFCGDDPFSQRNNECSELLKGGNLSASLTVTFYPYFKISGKVVPNYMRHYEKFLKYKDSLESPY